MYSMSIRIQYIQPPNPWPKCRGEAVSFGRSKAFLVRCSKHPQKLTIHKMCHPENLGKMIPTFDCNIFHRGWGFKTTQAVTNLVEKADFFWFFAD